MEAELVIEFAIHGLTLEQRAEPVKEVIEHRESPGGSGLLEDERDGGGQLVPGVGFGGELFPAGAREVVVLRLPVVVRRAPLGLDEATTLEAVQCRIERTLWDLQRGSRDLVQSLGDCPTMHCLKRQCLQDEQVERALGEINWWHCQCV